MLHDWVGIKPTYQQDHIKNIKGKICNLFLRRDSHKQNPFRSSLMSLPSSSITLFYCVQDDFPTPKTSVFDVLEIKLNNKLTLWCFQEHLGQFLLIPPLKTINNKLKVVKRSLCKAAHDMLTQSNYSLVSPQRSSAQILQPEVWSWSSPQTHPA